MTDTTTATPPRYIANLPERLRAIAMSLQADDPRVVTLDLAADELDRWRLLEAAKVIGGKVIG